MKTLPIAFAMSAASIFVTLAAEPSAVTPTAAVTWLAATPAARILDVRTKEKSATGHLSKAVLIPWADKDLASRAAKELDPGKPLLVYCRSAEAASALSKLGFTDVRNV